MSPTGWPLTVTWIVARGSPAAAMLAPLSEREGRDAAALQPVIDADPIAALVVAAKDAGSGTGIERAVRRRNQHLHRQLGHAVTGRHPFGSVGGTMKHAAAG